MSKPADKISKTAEEMEIEATETREWLEALDYVITEGGSERVRRLFTRLHTHALKKGIQIPYAANTPYINTIAPQDQAEFPGDFDVEVRLKSYIRWNAMAMVVRANREEDGIGGHISTFASATTLYEVALNHFIRGKGADGGGDLVFFQGHAAPGIYARAFLEGRLTVRQLENFRRELQPEKGLSSYPHPWLMPSFWEFPTVSMGLGPIMAIYQARFNRYLEDRGIQDTSDSRVWTFLGDGETDEPESLGAISLAAREQLDNLIFVINCNLQRLDGPVRGNGQIIQELERVFRGAGWNVIKVIWGRTWDPLLEMDETGALVELMNETVDGQWQKFSVAGPEYFRKHFWDKNPEVKRIGDTLTDEQLTQLKRGGHDTYKMYAAYQAAMENQGSPTVILAKTVKGYGLGEAGEGKNITHQQKKLNLEELLHFRERFDIPISDEELASAPFFRPAEDSPEIIYLTERRQELGGFVPSRVVEAEPLEMPPEHLFDEFIKGTGDRPVTTTMAIVRVIARLLREKEGIGKHVVPIIPDEARTFGMEALFSQFGIYSHVGQLYEPTDAGSLMFYREAIRGQIIEEGITEAGSISSFIAAGTSYASHGVNMIPFFIFYSMFGFQRVGDLIWAAADMRCRGFLVGGTAGRTTLAGEGLQHQDGNSHLLACTVPNLIAYDPAFAFEIGVIVREGIRRMYENCEDVFYYLTVENESYPMPEMPEGVEEGILKGLYCYRPSRSRAKHRVQLLASGAILNQALSAQKLLSERFNIASDVWSATSFKELHRDGMETDRWNMLHPGEKPRVPYIRQCLGEDPVPIVIASDYVKALPNSLVRWMPGVPVTLGTDGFGRSESREALRDFFEVDSRFIALGALTALAGQKKIKRGTLEKAIKELEINPSKPNPLTA